MNNQKKKKKAWSAPSAIITGGVGFGGQVGKVDGIFIFYFQK
jgi:lipid-binding SYLF domain-containing protein